MRPVPATGPVGGIGSFALLMLVGLLFGRPILRTLSDFRRWRHRPRPTRSPGSPTDGRWRRSSCSSGAGRSGSARRSGSSWPTSTTSRASTTVTATRPATTSSARSAEVFAARVRQVDHAARYGGEEFAVLVPETDLAGVIRLAERLRVDLAEAQASCPTAARSRSPRASASPSRMMSEAPRSSSPRQTKPCTRPSARARTASLPVETVETEHDTRDPTARTPPAEAGSGRTEAGNRSREETPRRSPPLGASLQASRRASRTRVRSRGDA